MKKIFLTLSVIAMTLSLMAQSDIKLPEPEKKGGMTLNEALINRQTNRTFSDQQLTEQEISNLLWAANGINRPDGKRTAPSARNAQEIDVYVAMKTGLYKYEPNDNALRLISNKDLRHNMSPRPQMIEEAPVALIFFANYDKMKNFDDASKEFYGATDAGFVSQNVYLHCAANHLNTVVMGYIDRDAIRDMIQVDGKAILVQPVGYPKK